MGVRCEICGEGEVGTAGVPDVMCWDGSATATEIDQWLTAALAVGRGVVQGRLLATVLDPRAVPALRRWLARDRWSAFDGRPHLLASIVVSLARCGDATVEPLMRRFLEAEHPEVRAAARKAITEYDLPWSADLVAVGLETTETAEELADLLTCLLWLRDDRALPPLRDLLESEGILATLGGRLDVATRLAAAGGPADRERIAELALEDAESAASPGDPRPDWARRAGWKRLRAAIGSVHPVLLGMAEDALSDRARALVLPLPAPDQDAWLASTQTVPRTVPRRSIVGYRESPLEHGEAPPAKFRGQPDWRDTPAWPVGRDGRLLMFYGQLPLPGGRTAYLFTAGPDEWELLGGGSAVVVQPGSTCHLETREVAVGPQVYDWVTEHSRFLVRSKRAPGAERYPIFADGLDPEEYGPGKPSGDEDWNKIGGTMVGLQGRGRRWASAPLAFQFTAELAGGERGDAAIFYGLEAGGGVIALGWEGS